MGGSCFFFLKLSDRSLQVPDFFLFLAKSLNIGNPWRRSTKLRLLNLRNHPTVRATRSPSQALSHKSFKSVRPTVGPEMEIEIKYQARNDTAGCDFVARWDVED